MSLQIERLSFSFENKTVLKELSFTVKKGEFVAIIGPSGSGKSTLLHLIGGLLSPEEGQIYLNGQKVTNQKGNMSYMPQDASLLPWRTVLENVLLGQELRGTIDREQAI